MLVAGQLPMLNLEFSWGKWSGDDIKTLEKPLGNVVGRVGPYQPSPTRIHSTRH